MRSANKAILILLSLFFNATVIHAKFQDDKTSTNPLNELKAESKDKVDAKGVTQPIVGKRELIGIKLKKDGGVVYDLNNGVPGSEYKPVVDDRGGRTTKLGNTDVPADAIGYRWLNGQPDFQYPSSPEPVVAGKDGEVLINGVPADPKKHSKFLSSLGVLLVSRKPETDFTKKFIKKYYDIDLNPAATVPHNFKLETHEEPLKQAAHEEPVVESSMTEKMKSLVEDPKAWKVKKIKDCKDEKCKLVTVYSHPKLGTIQKSEGLKNLLQEVEVAQPQGTVQVGLTGAGYSKYHVASLEAVQEMIDELPEGKQLTLMIAGSNCGPCQSMKPGFIAGADADKNGNKYAIFEIPNYGTGVTLTPEIAKAFKSVDSQGQPILGIGSFPTTLRLTK